MPDQVKPLRSPRRSGPISTTKPLRPPKQRRTRNHRGTAIDGDLPGGFRSYNTATCGFRSTHRPIRGPPLGEPTGCSATEIDPTAIGRPVVDTAVAGSTPPIDG